MSSNTTITDAKKRIEDLKNIAKQIIDDSYAKHIKEFTEQVKEKIDNLKNVKDNIKNKMEELSSSAQNFQELLNETKNIDELTQSLTTLKDDINNLESIDINELTGYIDDLDKLVKENNQPLPSVTSQPTMEEKSNENEVEYDSEDEFPTLFGGYMYGRKSKRSKRRKTISKNKKMNSKTKKRQTKKRTRR